MDPPPSTAGLVNPRRFRLRNNIAEISHDRVDPISLLPNRGDRALSFFIPKTTSRCVDFSNIQLHLRLRLVNGPDGGPLKAGPKSYIIPGFVPATIFGSLAVRINDTEVTNATQYPLLAKFLMLTQVDEDRRRALLGVNEFAGWDEENVNERPAPPPSEDPPSGDEKEEANKENKPPADADGGSEASGDEGAAAPRTKRAARNVYSLLGRFHEYKLRSRRFQRDGGRGSCTFSSYLLTELAAGADKPLVLPPCDISLEFLPAEPARSIITDANNPTARVEIMEAHLTVPRVLPRGGTIPRSLRWNFLRTRICPIIVPKNRTEFHAVLNHSGQIGRRISLFLLERDNWEGNYRSSIYRSHPYNLESVELHVGSRVLPTSRIRANFERRETNEMYLYVLDSLKWSLRKTGAIPDMLEKLDWEQGAFIWSADTTVDRSADAGYKGMAESGAVNLTLNFRKKTPSQLVVVAVTEATGELAIHSDGAVKVSD